ncbi:hypothetical protein FF011L_23730 [Roseimaritima multifibrata]|uniref:Uncharacterized protein n=1 Tax=Roseimaritima multifibrata TaxID=1930274 RepID=A0A517MFD6_9BACT|nr:hypothetical protein FF011L_23730 [Roseimaritima multifibrata]
MRGRCQHDPKQAIRFVRGNLAQLFAKFALLAGKYAHGILPANHANLRE